MGFLQWLQFSWGSMRVMSVLYTEACMQGNAYYTRWPINYCTCCNGHAYRKWSTTSDGTKQTITHCHGFSSHCAVMPLQKGPPRAAEELWIGQKWQQSRETHAHSAPLSAIFDASAFTELQSRKCREVEGGAFVEKNSDRLGVSEEIVRQKHTKYRYIKLQATLKMQRMVGTLETV